MVFIGTSELLYNNLVYQQLKIGILWNIEDVYEQLSA